MKASKKSQISKFVSLFMSVVFIAMSGPAQPAPPLERPKVSLPAVELEAFSDLPALHPRVITPSLKDQSSTADKAVNYQQVMAFLGVQLTPGQQKFLNEHKFLLIPKSATRFKGKMDHGEMELCWDEMIGLFDSLSGDRAPVNRRPENCRFVNPDVFLHAFHKYLENSLEYLERTELADTLRRFLTNMQTKALEYRAETSGKLSEHYELIGAQLLVPLVILENANWPAYEKGRIAQRRRSFDDRDTDKGDTLENALKILARFKDKFSDHIFNRMATELRLIYGVRDIAPSPLYGQYAKNVAGSGDYTQFTSRGHYAESPVLGSYIRAIPLYGQYTKNEVASGDYTQFTPWGHYEGNSILRSYFRAMMYLGRNGYPVGKEEGATDALLVALLMGSPDSNGQPLLKDWQRIIEITGFFAGKSDDLSYPEWRNFLVKVLGTEKINSGEAVDPATLSKITRQLGELKGPRVFSEAIDDPGVSFSTKEQLMEAAKAFRIFGQRFTFDGWVLNRLTAGREKTPLRLPSTPSALFAPAVLGDKVALGFADQYLQNLSPPFSPEETTRFNDQLQKVALDLKMVKDSEWFSSVTGAWLKLLGTLTSAYAEGYPLYMQDQLFRVKQVETFLGSYADLKHDTLLYTKQNFAEGEGPEGTPPPVAKGFVEPNLLFWETLARLVDYVEGGYKKYGLFKIELMKFGSLSRFKETVAFCASMAAKELQGIPITEQEYEKIRVLSLMNMAAPHRDTSSILQEKDMRSGLIADLHTDTVKRQILYEATGEPYVMLVMLGNEGTVRLAVGVAFNHYEFTGPLATRYTDSDWQSRVYENRSPLPEKNFWYRSLVIK